MIRSSLVGRILAVFALGAVASPAVAQSSRTWVSGTGVDSNPCSRTLPCRTFAGALAKTIAFGEIDALDPGEFDAVTIDKAITIDGGPGVAGVTASGGVGITVDAGPTGDVTLRHLSVRRGSVSPLAGISINSGRRVFIEDCSVAGFTSGIYFSPSSGMTVTLANTTIRYNAFGIDINALGAAFYARLTAAHLSLVNNDTGMLLKDNALVFVSDSIASGNFDNGFYVQSSGGAAAQLDLENVSSSNNGNAGIVSENPGALVRISNSTIDHNLGAGVVPLAGGLTLSYGNNKIAGNAGGDGTMTGSAPIK